MTVTMLSWRLLQAVTDGGSTVEWVKTRGHADKYVKQRDVSVAAYETVMGNQAADAADLLVRVNQYEYAKRVDEKEAARIEAEVEAS